LGTTAGCPRRFVEPASVSRKALDFGTCLGTAHNAQLNTNRFCNVTTSALVEPLANEAEHDTLTCGVPPALVIAPTVLLSWPSDEPGWTVDSGPAVDGPWARLAATPLRQYRTQVSQSARRFPRDCGRVRVPTVYRVVGLA
jgi:hypothetical protein